MRDVFINAFNPYQKHYTQYCTVHNIREIKPKLPRDIISIEHQLIN